MSSYDKQDVPTAAIVSFVGDETYEFEAYGSENTDLKYGDNVEQGDELVRRSDALKEKMMALKFALEAYDRDHREAIRQKLDEVKGSVEQTSDEVRDQ